MSQTGPENPARSLDLLSRSLLCATSSLFIVPNHFDSRVSADAPLFLLITNAGLQETCCQMCFSTTNLLGEGAVLRSASLERSGLSSWVLCATIKLEKGGEKEGGQQREGIVPSVQSFSAVYPICLLMVTCTRAGSRALVCKRCLWEL